MSITIVDRSILKHSQRLVVQRVSEVSRLTHIQIRVDVRSDVLRKQASDFEQREGKQFFGGNGL